MSCKTNELPDKLDNPVWFLLKTKMTAVVKNRQKDAYVGEVNNQVREGNAETTYAYYFTCITYKVSQCML